MSDPVYDIADRRTLGYDVVDDMGNPVDPEFISFLITEPGGRKTKIVTGDPELINPAVGTWEITFVCQRPGRHIVRVETSGNVQMGDEYFFQVRRPQAYKVGEFVLGRGRATAAGIAPTVSAA